MYSCFPSSSLALLPLQPFAIVRTVLVQGGWWYCAITYITQSVPHTGVTQCTPYQYCTHPKFHVSTVHTYVYIHICFNWAICHHQIYFKFPWQLSTSCTLSHWKHLSRWNECPTKMFLLRINKLVFYCILFFYSLRPASVVVSSGRPSLRRDCWASVTSRWSSWMEEQRCVILQCSHWIMHSVCTYSTISQCVLVEVGDVGTNLCWVAEAKPMSRYIVCMCTSVVDFLCHNVTTYSHMYSILLCSLSLHTITHHTVTHPYVPSHINLKPPS